MQIIPLPAFSDNYIWLLRSGRHAAVVDPGDAAPVLRHLADEGLTLVAILVTHHHPDHVGGIEAILDAHPVPVFGPAMEDIAGITHPVSQDDEVLLPELGAEFRVLDLPGHTAGHVGYYGEGALFCGDTLFAAGCRRLFEGTPAQMYDSLGKLAALPGDTQVYCTHEYTLSNLAFALQVEPNSTVLRQRYALEQARRHAEQPTLPSQMALEKQTNPFLRVHLASVAQPIQQHCQIDTDDEVTLFAALREWKNRS